MAGQEQHDMETRVRPARPQPTAPLSVDRAGSAETVSGSSAGKQFCSASPEQ